MTRINNKTFWANHFWRVTSKVLLSALLIGISICLSRVSLAAESQAPQSVVLPKSISNIRLTMSLKNLIAARKNVENYFSDGKKKVNPNKPDAWLRESFHSPSLFDSGEYYFDKYSLATIVLSGGRNDTKNQHRDTFIREMLRLYGDPDKIVVVDQPVRDASIAPGLIWWRNGVLILVDFALDAQRTGSRLYEFKAFDANSPTSKEFYDVPGIKESKKTQIITEAKALIARLREK